MVRLEDRSADIPEIWETSRANWHHPQLPRPVIGSYKDSIKAGTGSSINGKKGGHGHDLKDFMVRDSIEFPFENYRITLSEDILDQGPRYIENLFDHLIVHYIFCPRSLETSGTLALSAIRGLKNPASGRRMVNIFSDIVTDSFRLERSPDDEDKVLLGWKRLGRQDLSDADKVVLGFLKEYWQADLPGCDRPEVDLLMQVYSPGVRKKEIWGRQCQQTARILEPLEPRVLGRGPVRSLEILNGNADRIPMPGISVQEPQEYEKVLAVLGLKGDLKRWYRDQSCFIEIRSSGKVRTDLYPSGLVKWKLTDPPCDLDITYSMSISPKLIPGITTFKRTLESSRMAEGKDQVPDLLIVLDSSKSMGGHSMNTKTHKATLAAFKACQFAHSQGAMVAAVNFSERYLVQPWTRDLGLVEDVLVECLYGRTSIPGKAVLDLARERKGCLILCITDTQIQNLYAEWDYLKELPSLSRFVLFCIDQAGRDKWVFGELANLGTVHYIDKLDDLLYLVVETAENVYANHTQ